jgi:hypothetical protein
MNNQPNRRKPEEQQEKSHKHAKRISFGFTACSLHNAKCIMGISYLT